MVQDEGVQFRSGHCLKLDSEKDLDLGYAGENSVRQRPFCRQLTVHTFDAGLVCAGTPMTILPYQDVRPNMEGGVAFNLFNNAWGTNYVGAAQLLPLLHNCVVWIPVCTNWNKLFLSGHAQIMWWPFESTWGREMMPQTVEGKGGVTMKFRFAISETKLL